MSHSPLPSQVTEPLPAIESALDRFVSGASMPSNLREAVRYALLGGGKRLRPLLAWHSAVAVGGRGESALSAAVAVELIHAFSLVHDDLPAMDDDDLRRGRPTLHIHAGEAMAILAGDAMTVLAFEAIAGGWMGGAGRGPVDASTALGLVRELSTGTLGMIVGQVYDTLGGLPDSATAGDRVGLIHSHKTGALIRASCRMGAMLGGASPPALEAISAYGDAVGLMFQIVDDLLDVTQPVEHLGKRSGKDAEAGKVTFPAVLGVEGSRAAIERERLRAAGALAPLGEAARPLVDLGEYMAVRTK